MKRTLESTSEPCLRASGNEDGNPSLVQAGESSTSSSATPQARNAMNCEDTATMDSGAASSTTTRGKKPRLAPEEGVLQPSDETIPIASSKDGTKELGSKAYASTVVNLSIIHGPSGASLSNVPAEAQFPYQPLDISKLEIRVITLHPGIRTAPIHCSLMHIATNSKSTKPIYKALSYTWGTAETPKTIILDGMQVQVRENLWQALYHLRSEEHELTIWIDALCINQNDVQERSSQVSRMSAIYGIAKEVIVWLGPADEDSELAMDFIQHNFHPSSGPRGKDIPMDELLLKASEEELRGITKLMAREYWHRVWIIQEIFRARRVTIQCGHDTMKWSSLSKFFRYLSRQPEQAGVLQQRDFHEKHRFLLDACTSPAKSLTEHRTSQQHCLEDLLEAYKGCHSSDPRDKVYAFIGLAQRKMTTHSNPVKKGDKWIEVDYSKPALHIFRTLVILFDEAQGGNTRIYRKCGRVRWMQTVQEVLDLGDSFDNGNGLGMTMVKQSEKPYSGSLLAMDCAGYCISTNDLYRRHWSAFGTLILRADSSISPTWFPLTQDDGHILKWYDSLPGVDHSRVAREYLELMLRYFRDNDLERLKKFEDPYSRTCAEPNHSVRISVLLEGSYFLLASFPIENDSKIFLFHSSDIALVVKGAAVVGRALVYKVEREEGQVDRSIFRVAYPTLPDTLDDSVVLESGWPKIRITLSIDDWARVVSLGKRQVSE